MKAGRRVVLSTSAVSSLEAPLVGSEQCSRATKTLKPVSAFESMFQSTTAHKSKENQENQPPMSVDSISGLPMGGVLADSSMSTNLNVKKGRTIRQQSKKQAASRLVRQTQASRKENKKSTREQTGALASADLQGGLSGLFAGGHGQHQTARRKANQSIKQRIKTKALRATSTSNIDKSLNRDNSYGEESVLASMKELSISKPHGSKSNSRLKINEQEPAFGGLSMEKTVDDRSKTLMMAKDHTDTAYGLGEMFDTTQNVPKGLQFTPKNKDNRKRRTTLDSAAWKISSVMMMDDDDEFSNILSMDDDGDNPNLPQHASSRVFQSPPLVQPFKRADSKLTPIKCTFEMEKPTQKETENITSTKEKEDTAQYHIPNPLIQAIETSKTQEESMKPDPDSRTYNTVSIPPRHILSRPDPSPTPLFNTLLPTHRENSTLRHHITRRPDPPAINTVKKQFPLHHTMPMNQQARDPTPCKIRPSARALSLTIPEQQREKTIEKDLSNFECQEEDTDKQKSFDRNEVENVIPGFVDSETDHSNSTEEAMVENPKSVVREEAVSTGFIDSNSETEDPSNQGEPEQPTTCMLDRCDSSQSNKQEDEEPCGGTNASCFYGEDEANSKSTNQKEVMSFRDDAQTGEIESETAAIDDATDETMIATNLSLPIEPDMLMESIGRRARKQPFRFGDFASQEQVETTMRRCKRKPRSKRVTKGRPPNDTEVQSKEEEATCISKARTQKSIHSTKTYKKAIPVDEDNVSESDASSTASDAENDWPESEVAALRKAHSRVDPTSSFFWDRVASFMDGRTGKECSAKWFSLVATPKAQRPKNRPAHFQSTRNTDMDDFNESTSSPSVPSTRQSLDLGSPITFAVIDEPNGTLHTQRPALGNKKYVNELKKAIKQSQGEGRKKRVAKKKPVAKKRNQFVSESLREGDLEFQAQMTPGGTLEVRQVNSPDDFWEDTYGLSDEEEEYML